jgi:hypothetical protein
VPLAGGTVHFEGLDAPASVVTDGSGRFVRDRFPAGSYRVRPEDGLHDFYFDGELGEPVFDVADDVLDCDFDAAPLGARVDILSPNGADVVYSGASLTITFRVTGDPGPQIALSYRSSPGGQWQPIETFDLPAPSVGDVAQWREHSVVWQPLAAMTGVRVRAQSTTYPVLQDRSDGTFVVEESAAVSGRVTHLAAPMDGVQVQFYEDCALRYTTLTGVDGIYALSGIAPGTYAITPSLMGFAFEAGALGSTAVLVAGDALTGFDFTAIPIGASVMITSPNGGELVFGGTSIFVAAATPHLDGYPVDVDADLDGDGVYEHAIASDVLVASATTTVPWDVPVITGGVELTQVRVRILQTDLSLGDESDAPFIVSEQFVLSGVVSVDGDIAVEDARITFEGATAPEAVTTDATGMWWQNGFRRGRAYTVRAVAPSTGGAYAVDAPLIPLERFGAVVCDADGDGVFAGAELTYHDASAPATGGFPVSVTTPQLSEDIEHIDFYAAPAGATITVVHPTGIVPGSEGSGDVWLDGYDAKTIEWTSAGGDQGATVQIDYSASAGATWNATPLFAAAVNGGSQSWVVGTGAPVSYGASIRVIDNRYRLVRASSPVPFVLAPSGTMTVRTEWSDGSLLDDVVIAVVPEGYVEFTPPAVDPPRPFLTAGAPATDVGVFPNGTYRLTPSKVGHTFEPASVLVGAASDTTFVCTGDGDGGSGRAALPAGRRGHRGVDRRDRHAAHAGGGGGRAPGTHRRPASAGSHLPALRP